MKRALMSLTVIAAGLVAYSAQSKLMFETEAALAVRLSTSLDRVSKAMALNERDAVAVRQGALAWFYVGPCRARDVSAQDAADAISMASGGLLGAQQTMAMHAMIGLLAADFNLGREPGEIPCKVIKGLAFPMQPVR